jgi:hypothetical protein
MPKKRVYKYSTRRIKITQNQLQIFDALLNDGGVKKYVDSNNNLRYSEHAGIFDFNKCKLERLIISGDTNREDEDDTDILFPEDNIKALDYEYIFHTHPPTPYPGARAEHGILYEFPSIADLYHFAYHHNDGKIQGSIIIAPEGIYIIRLKKNVDSIPYPSEKIAKKMEILHTKIQALAIRRHGADYISEARQKYFYEVVAQDRTYIKMFNKLVKKYFNENIVITYKAREYDVLTDKWIMKNMYVKVEPVEIK